jgi:hypothetical protein
MEEQCLGLGKRGLSVNALLSRAVRSWVLLRPSWAKEIVSIDGFLSGEGLRVYSTLLRCLRLSYVVARCLVLPAVRLSVCLGRASVKELRGVLL